MTTAAEIRIPSFLVTAGPPGHFDTETEGLEHPVRLARYADELEHAGLHALAYVARAALVAVHRCAGCGRQLSSDRARHSVFGRECVRPSDRK